VNELRDQKHGPGAIDADTKARELRARLVDDLVAAGSITTKEVKAAFRTVPRHLFAPEASLEEAYADDIVRTKRDANGMTVSSVSAPWLQAAMLEQADISPGMRVLEVGSGGFNAALIAELVGPTGEVTTIDIDPDVTDRASRCLAPEHEAGPPPGADRNDRRRDPWLHHRDLAHRIVDDWVAKLPDVERAQFASASQSVPRSRAVAGVHALLDAGQEPGRLAAALTRDAHDDIHAGAAVLAQRVAGLCEHADVDLALYELPDPATAQQEWNDLVRHLDRAEIAYLATRSTATLAAERRSLSNLQSRSEGATRTPTSVRAQVSAAADGLPPATAARAARLARVEAALDRQTAEAVLRAANEPASYLTAMLGPRPTADSQAASWESAAGQVERYRHHHLGLPFGKPATPGASEPIRQALADRPTEPRAADAYDRACTLNTTPNAQLPL